MTYDPEDETPWAALPAPEVLPVQRMLEELEVVNVLAPLVRCSKRESAPPVAVAVARR